LPIQHGNICALCTPGTVEVKNEMESEISRESKSKQENTRDLSAFGVKF